MITFGDLFAGGGGVTTGAFSLPDLHVSWALNHDKTAIETHEINHPETKHYQADIRTQDVSKLDQVDVLWASTECTQFSKAKGGGLKDIGSYMLGWELIRYIEHCEPSMIFIENVPEFIRWAPLVEMVNKDGEMVWIPDETRIGEEYQKWVNTINNMGYWQEYNFLNAADHDAPTRRTRYIGIFTRIDEPILWPSAVRSQHGRNGLPKWRACKDFIDLVDEGHSIFNRKNNKLLARNHQKPYCANTLRRFAGGTLKNSDLIHSIIKEQFISKYYGNGINCHGINEPLHTIRTKSSHCLITVEKRQFISDHVQTDNYQTPEEPLRPQLTRQTKQLLSLKTQFISTQNSSNGNPEHNTASLLNPLNAISTEPKHQFITANFGGNGRPESQVCSIDNPLNSLTTKDKFQFLTAQFNSNGNPETQIQSLDNPLNAIKTSNCFSIATLSEGQSPEYLSSERMEFASIIYQVACGNSTAQPIETIQAISFHIKDIKARFLNKDELGPIMGFPKGYFAHLSDKKAIKLIGNAVPTWLAAAVLRPNVEYLQTNLIKEAI